MNIRKQTITAVVLAITFYIASITALFAQFTMTPGSYITIKDGSTIRIGSNLMVQGNATSSAYFVDQTMTAGDVNITGNVTVERYLSDNVWHNVAIPVATANTSIYGGTWLTFYYDETYIENDWMFGWFDFSGPLTPMRGYDVFLDAGPLTVSYTGTGAQLNTGTYSFGVTNSTFVVEEPASRKGWNLAGNPYPSPVDWQFASGWNKTSINDAKYIWNPTNDNYTIWLGGGAPIGINGGTQFIPSNQGFWVQAITNGTLQINNSCRNGDITGTPDFYKKSNITYPMVDIVASGNGLSDETVIRFLEGTTPGFDWNYDASKLISFGENVPQISTNAGKYDVLAINSLPEIINELEVSMNFQCASSGFFDIYLTDLTTLDNTVQVYLKDHIDQKIVNLSADSVYHFYHQITNKRGRFSILFNPSDDVINNITPDSYFTVYSFNNTITVIKNTTKQLNGKILVYNLNGQIICKHPLSNETKTSFSIMEPTGFYIVSIQTDQTVMNQKVLIKN
ncbi:MAG TPA: T9SS type A sorting domain-containing protein [Bacteroidales bacterium]